MKRPGSVWRLVPGSILFGCVALILSGCGRPAPAEFVYNADNAAVIGEQFEFGGSAGGGSATSAKFEDPERTPKWATLKGVIKVDDPGKVAPLSAIIATSDQGVCSNAPNERFVVNSGGGIKNVLIFLTEKLPNDSDEEQPKWTHERYSFSKTEANKDKYDSILPQQQREALFDQRKCVFLSHVFTMRTDQLMRIKNSDATLHNTNIGPKRNPSANMALPALSTDSYQPSKEEPEPFRVACNAHPWMGAWVIFRDSPYFAVTDENGQFEIVDIPADVELEFRVWQENLKWVSPSAVENAPEGWSRGKFKISLGEGETREITVTIDGSSFKP